MKYNDIRKYFKELFRTIYVHIILLITNKCQLRLFGVDSIIKCFRLKMDESIKKGDSETPPPFLSL